MDDFSRRDGRLHAESVPLDAVAAAVGTPTYVYSRHTLVDHYRRLASTWAALEPRIQYAVKANGNLALLRVLADEGAGFDVVSRGEIHRVIAAGGGAGTIEFAGVGKRRDEIEHALDVGIRGFTVESEAELALVVAIVRERGRTARVALRVNPDIDAHTHPGISTGRRQDKFGLPPDQALELARRHRDREGIRITGLHTHIGSQLTDVGPFRVAVERLLQLGQGLRADLPTLESLNIGGGFGIHYREGEAPSMRDFADAAVPLLRGQGFRIQLEPGRLLVGNAGVLITRVLLSKRAGEHRFVVCDAAMNDLLRPSLYGAFHRIEPVEPRPGAPEPVDVVGPVCETTDTFARDRSLPPLQAGDLLAIRSAGAYGFVMSSNYNGRPRPAEVLVDGDRFGVVRDRESLDDLVRGERVEPAWQRGEQGGGPGIAAAT